MIPLLDLAQQQHGGWLPVSAMNAVGTLFFLFFSLSIFPAVRLLLYELVMWSLSFFLFYPFSAFVIVFIVSWITKVIEVSL